MADFKFGSQNAKALRFEFELTTFDESGEQVECKPFLTHLTTQKKSCSTTDLSGVGRGSAFVFAHS
jgi:hypothetical protein